MVIGPRRLAGSGLVAVLTSVLLSACGGAQTNSGTDLLSTIKQRGYITIGTSGNNAPTIYRNPQGDLIGLDADWADLIAKGLGVKVQWTVLDFKGIVPGLAANKFDLAMSGLRVTAERAKTISFSAPYAYDSAVLVYPQSLTSSVNGPQDGIKGRAVCVVAGSSNGDQPVEKIGGYKDVHRFPGQAEAFQALKIGRCQVMVTGRILALNWIKTEGAGFQISTGDVDGTYIAVGMPKTGSSQLQAAVDKAINAAKSQGTCQSLATKWIGGPFPSAVCAVTLPPDYPAQAA